MRSLLGQMPHSGRIGVQWGDSRVIGYVPQTLDFDKSLPITVGDFMAMATQRRPVFLGVSKARRAEIDRTLERLGLNGKRKAKLGSLSGGERQRVLLAQALIPEPALLVLDEPTTGLDLAGKQILQRTIVEFAKAGGTVVWINHDIAQVGEIADALTYIDRKVLARRCAARCARDGRGRASVPDADAARPQGGGVMSALFDIPRQFIIGLADDNIIHYTFSYAFVVNGFLCAFVIGPLLGGIGTMVVAKRMAFFSQAVGNAALTGVAIGVIIGESYTAPYMSMFSFCLLFGLVLNFARNRTKMSADTLIGVFLSISLAIGATALLWVSAKVNTHILDTVMFGSILTVDDTDMTVLLVTTLLTLVTALPLFNQMLLASLNPSLAHVRGVRVHLLEYVFVLLLTILTVACVKIVGAVLVEALLLIPAAAARNLNRSIRGFVWWSIAFSTVACLVGIYAPMRWDLPLPSGGAIILAAALIFVVTIVLRMALPRYREASL